MHLERSRKKQDLAEGALAELQSQRGKAVPKPTGGAPHVPVSAVRCRRGMLCFLSLPQASSGCRSPWLRHALEPRDSAAKATVKEQPPTHTPPGRLPDLLKGALGGRSRIHHGPPLLLRDPISCWTLLLLLGEFSAERLTAQTAAPSTTSHSTSGTSSAGLGASPMP